MSRQRRKKQHQAPKRSFKDLWQSWYQAKAPLFQFCLKFCALMLLFYTLLLLPAGQRILAAWSVGYARLGSVILNRLGEGTQVTNATIWSAKYAVTVLPACSGIEFLFFFCATVIAFPSRLARKVPGILLGVTLLLILNQFRIVSLYYIGAHFPRLFDTTHEDLWGMVLIVAEIVLCVAWIGWARENDRPEPDAAG